MCRVTATSLLRIPALISVAGAAFFSAPAILASTPYPAAAADATYEYQETRELVSLVHEAAQQVSTKGEAAFAEFRRPGSRWSHPEMYIFVLDCEGNMLVHPDPAMQGKNEMGLKDVNGKPIVQGLIAAATAFPDKVAGWYHYEWPVPGGLLPRWKSSYVERATAPSGDMYVVGSGIYNDRMERSFVIDQVNDAAAQIEKSGTAAFRLFRDPTGPYQVKDSYVFVIDSNGVELANPAFPNLEGRSMLHQRDTNGKLFMQEMLQVVQTSGAGWVDYMWPKPGESVPTQKSAYVRKAKLGDRWLIVGCGVYLANAPKAAKNAQHMSAPDLMAMVRDGAALLEKEGAGAYPQFRTKGSKWFGDDTYLIVFSMDGRRVFHAADPSLEAKEASDVKDILGRPYVHRMIERASGPSGEGWVHYMYPKPGDIFPAWKSTFVKRVTFPDGKQYVVGSGIYDMQMDKALIEDVVTRAANLIATQGKSAFEELRDKTGPFVFMDTYVFVDAPDGTELVNPVQRSLEGKNLMELKDIDGTPVTKQYIAVAMENGSGWIDYTWYKPGENAPAHKQAFVRKVQSGADTYVVGSGYYTE